MLLALPIILAACVPGADVTPLSERSATGLELRAGSIATVHVPAEAQAPISVDAPLNDGMVTLDLVPETVRARGFRVIVQRADGSYFDAQPGPSRTFSGTVRGLVGSTVAASLSAEGLTASIHLPGETFLHWVEPLQQSLPERGATAGAHLAYRAIDSLGAPQLCGAGDPSKPTPLASFSRSSGSAGSERSVCGGTCVARLAIDSDYQYFQHYNDVELTVTKIESVVGQMNVQYMSEVGIRHELAAVIVRTSPTQPYTSSNSGGLLIQFQTEWNDNHADVQRDVAQLFSGKTFQSGVVGTAFVGTVCTPEYGYSVVNSDCCGRFVMTTDLTAHELGHSWNAQHCLCSFPNPDSTMNPGLTGANSFVTDVSGASVASITGWRDSVTCLQPDSPPPPPPGPFTAVYPPSGSFGVPTTTTLDWSDSQGAQYYILSLADEPTFTNPVFTVAVTQSQYTPPAPLHVGQRYYWRVRSWDDRSQNTPLSPVTASFITAVPPPPCPGDLDGNMKVDTADLAYFLVFFGVQVDPGTQGDINGDGIDNTFDLAILLSHFGVQCN